MLESVVGEQVISSNSKAHHKLGRLMPKQKHKKYLILLPVSALKGKLYALKVNLATDVGRTMN